MKQFRLILLFISAVLVVACTEQPTALVSRELTEDEGKFQIPDSTVERFRYVSRSGPSTASSSAQQSSGSAQLAYTTPDGWSEESATMMRDVSFKFGPNGEGECYLAKLPGQGGGLAANVNRWRGQFGAEPLSEEEIYSLPQRPLFGLPATFVSVEGDFSPGMGSTEVKEDHKLLGLILPTNVGTIFIKMTGPRGLVDENASRFDQFVSSIGVNQAG